MWRSKFDCTRNFVSMFAEKYLPRKDIICKSTDERLKMLCNVGYDLDGHDVDYAMKHGVILKVNGTDIDNSERVITVFYTFKNFTFSSSELKD